MSEGHQDLMTYWSKNNLQTQKKRILILLQGKKSDFSFFRNLFLFLKAMSRHHVFGALEHNSNLLEYNFMKWYKFMV
jgi:hypothetical protein